jgi:hypothetical protein
MLNDKKGQGLNIILIVFMAIIVGIALFITISQTVGTSTTTVTLENLTIGTQTNGTTYYLSGFKNVASAAIIGNGTNPVLLAAGNYTLTNNVVHPTTGELSVSILPASEYTATGWNISGTAQRTDYIDDSGARAIALLIPIFFALAIALITMIPSLRSEVLKMVSK